MASLKISSVFSLIVDLFNSVKLKDLTDGVTSIIRPYMVENTISMSTDQTSVNNAKADNVSFLAKEKEGKKVKGKINKRFNPKLKFYQKCGQFLKGYYGESFLDLGDWGYTIEVGGKIVYSTNKKDLCDSIQTMITFHLAFPAGTSPLDPFLLLNNYNVLTIESDLGPTKTMIDSWLTIESDKVAFRISRDNHIKPVLKHLRGIGKFLKGVMLENPADIGDWGYLVVMSTKEPTRKDLELGHLEVKTISHIINGSDFINTKGTIITAFKGKLAVGTSKTIPAGGKIIVQRGWGTMTLKNMSDSDLGGISYLGGN